VAVRFHEPVAAPTAERPFILNTGRVRDQWHTMTRTGVVPRLAAHTPEPLLALNAADAGRLGIQPGGLTRIESPYGTALARAAPSPDIPPGMVFLPMHWNDQFAAQCVSGRLVNAYADAVSGQPELKHTPVSLAPVPARWAAFLVTRAPVTPARHYYWARHAIDGGLLYDLAGPETPASMLTEWQQLLPPSPGDESVEYRDARRGSLRLALLNGGALKACLFAGPDGSLPARDALLAQFSSDAPLEDSARAGLLSGRGAGMEAGAGRVICACFNVGLAAIVAAIRDQALSDVKQIGRLLRAGTNCGSCVPELKDIIRQETRLAAIG
jgi:assimilatory nitrate reductase catalytic subunit